MQPGYWSNKLGTQSAPIIITTDTGAMDTNGTTAGTMSAALIAGVNMFNCSYIYFLNLQVYDSYITYHFATCNNILVRNKYGPVSYNFSLPPPFHPARPRPLFLPRNAKLFIAFSINYSFPSMHQLSTRPSLSASTHLWSPWR